MILEPFVAELGTVGRFRETDPGRCDTPGPMWIIFGRNVKTERVPGGKVVERTCQQCGENAMFYERRVTQAVSLYFVDVYNYKQQRAMACGACGALFSTDELGSAEEEGRDLQAGTLAGALKGAWDVARDAVQTGASRLLDPTTATPARPRAPAAPPPEPVHDESAYDPDAELNARFAELERKSREKRGGSNEGGPK